MLKIYGSPQSSAGRCFFALMEAGVEFETKRINFKEKEHKSAEFLEINPNGKVPVLVDGETVVWESMAINYYICDQYKPELLGADAKERAHVQQWSIWGLGDLQAPFVEMLIEKFFVPAEKKNPEVNTNCMLKLDPLLKMLDSHLQQNDYLTGKNFTLAELNVVSVLDIAGHIGVSLSDFSNIGAWLDRCHQRDSYQKYLKLQNPS
jgi:glutathione S-transferase